VNDSLYQHIIENMISYFNLSGGKSIEKTKVTLSTDKHLPVDDDLIPTGDITPYPGGFAHSTFTLGPQEPDIDHCFILNTDPSSISSDSRGNEMRKLASFFHPETKIHLEVHSTEPAFQFYTGKFIDVPAVGDHPARGPRSGFCVEPSRYVNAVNTEKWKSMAILKKGDKYGSRTRYVAWEAQG
jgi:aldose 1-epimerase